MKSFAAFAVTLGLLAALSMPTLAQSPKPSPTPSAKQPVRPRPSMKGVGTKKIEHGAKTAGRKTEGAVGRGASSVKKSVSQNARNLQNALGGKKKAPAPAATPKP